MKAFPDFLFPPAQTTSSSQKSSNGPWFTFDDISSYKWRDRLNEMSAWIDLQILPSKFQRPIPAIGLLDTRAQRSMINPDILPSQSCQHYEENFKAVNGKFFTTKLITKKPISIQIFPNCVI